jgi:hypothetical protein
MLEDRAIGTFYPEEIGSTCFLPGQREEPLKVCLEVAELALDHHAFLRAVAVTVFYHNMDVNACQVTVRTGDMKFPRLFGKMFIETAPLHALLYNFTGACIPTFQYSCLPLSIRGNPSKKKYSDRPVLSQFSMIRWRGVVGIEPTTTQSDRNTGFADQVGHQPHTPRSHISLKTLL